MVWRVKHWLSLRSFRVRFFTPHECRRGGKRVGVYLKSVSYPSFMIICLWLHFFQIEHLSEPDYQSKIKRVVLGCCTSAARPVELGSFRHEGYSPMTPAFTRPPFVRPLWSGELNTAFRSKVSGFNSSHHTSVGGEASVLVFILNRCHILQSISI